MRSKFAVLIVLLAILCVGLVTILYTPPIDSRPENPYLRKRILIGGGGGEGYDVCSCYDSASCDLEKNRCAAGTGTCQKCVTYDENGYPLGTYLVCPAQAECD